MAGRHKLFTNLNVSLPASLFVRLDTKTRRLAGRVSELPPLVLYGRTSGVAGIDFASEYTNKYRAA